MISFGEYCSKMEPRFSYAIVFTRKEPVEISISAKLIFSCVSCNNTCELRFEAAGTIDIR